jgi:hypothetical protein
LKVKEKMSTGNVGFVGLEMWWGEKGKSKRRRCSRKDKIFAEMSDTHNVYCKRVHSYWKKSKKQIKIMDSNLKSHFLILSPRRREFQGITGFHLVLTIPLLFFKGLNLDINMDLYLNNILNFAYFRFLYSVISSVQYCFIPVKISSLCFLFLL